MMIPKSIMDLAFGLGQMPQQLGMKPQSMAKTGENTAAQDSGEAVPGGPRSFQADLLAFGHVYQQVVQANKDALQAVKLADQQEAVQTINPNSKQWITLPQNIEAEILKIFLKSQQSVDSKEVSLTNNDAASAETADGAEDDSCQGAAIDESVISALTGDSIDAAAWPSLQGAVIDSNWIEALVDEPGLALSGTSVHDFQKGLLDAFLLTQQSPSANLSNAGQASLLIRQAITAVSETLHLQLGKDLEGLEITNPSEAIIAQFSNIVHALMAISKLLVKAIEAGQPVEIKDVAFDTEHMVSVERLLRVQIFQMQVGFKMLGVSKDVAAAVAEKQQLPASEGIPQAVDLSSRSMPLSQVKELFQGMIDSQRQDVKELVEKVVASVRQDAVQKLAAVSLQSDLPAHTALAEDNSSVELGVFDRLTMRRLLKIDSADVQSQNLLADRNARKLDMPKSSAIPTAINPSEIQHKSSPDNMQIANILEKATNWDALASALGKRLPAEIEGSARESMMTQIIEKMHIALKQGAQEIRLILRPESLGEVRIKLQVHGDVVVAKMQVESLQVKQVIEGNFNALRNALQEHNLQAGSLEVDVDGGTREHAREPNEGEGHGHERATTAASSDDGESPAESGESKSGVAQGEETGRRFGTNSVEYFA